MGVLFGVLAVVLVGIVVLANSHTPLGAPRLRNVPVIEEIASGQIVVRANGLVQYRFQVTPQMRDAHVTGQFNASGGNGNDIEALLATEDEFTNWINGHQARVNYGTGRKTADTFDVRLAPGRYCLAFNNRFSLLTAKEVFLEVNLRSNRTETF